MPLHPLTLGLVLLVAALHVGFLVLEMFLWSTPTGRKVFGTTREQMEHGAVLAKNQGLYNGFLAAGLLWGVFHMGTAVGPAFIVFFLLCVVVAGLYGAATAARAILFVQALPAAAALASFYTLS